MAWTQKLPNGKYYGCFRRGKKKDKVRDAFGKPIQYTSERAAKKAAFRADDKARNPDARNPDAGKITWGAWCDEWWPRHKETIEANSVSTYGRYLRTVIRDRWGDEPLDEIARDLVQDWVDEIPMAPSSVSLIYAVFATSMKAAVVGDKLGASPCIGIELPLIEPEGARYLRTDELDGILAFLEGAYEMLVLLCVGTGMRWGEAAALHWQDVHFDLKTITIRWSYSVEGKHIKITKGRRKRTVPLAPWLAEKLHDWKNGQPADKRCLMTHVAPKRRNHARTTTRRPRAYEPPPVKCRSGLVLPRPLTTRCREPGACLDYQSSRGSFNHARDLAMVAHVTLHDLRDTYASTVLQAGFTIEQVAELLGDRDIQMVRDRYASHGTSQFDKIAAALPAPMSAPMSAPPAPTAPVVPQRDEAQIIDFAARRRSKAQ